MATTNIIDVSQLRVRDLEAGELDRAVGILARGMRDNPLHIRVFGEDAVGRVQALERFLGALLRSAMSRGGALCARRGGSMVGVLGMAERRLTLGEAMPVLPAMLSFSPVVMARMARWFGEWRKREPREPHWHLGPVAVEARLQGKGIGSAMMAAFCARADERGALTYLGTDKRLSVAFYRKFGFETIDESEVLGVPSWFMTRRAGAPACSIEC